MNKDLFYFKGIRKKLILFFLIMLILFSGAAIYSYKNAVNSSHSLNSIVSDYVYLNDLNNDIDLLETQVETYLSTKSSESLLSYYKTYNRLQESSLKISNEVVSDTDRLMLKDIRSMIGNLLIESDKAVQAKRGRTSSEYIAHFTRAKEINSYIKLYVNDLLNNKLEDSSNEYDIIYSKMQFMNLLNIFIILFSIIFSAIIAIYITYRITKPIIELSNAAKRVSDGDLNIDPVVVNTNDEISILGKAFNNMIESIKNYIQEIKDQAEVEKRLKEQEMQNFKIKTLLKDAELKSLQSQINPHFLFNTLNVASQLALIEDAEKTSEFIQKFSDLFRYNLRKIEEPVTIRDEIEITTTYMYILKTRFGDRIEFIKEIDESILDIQIPCTIIQPIIENAYIHGLEDLERDGAIKLIIKIEESNILIQIIDNGAGMCEEQIKSILSNNKSSSEAKSHVTGIGMQNVIDRLKIFYNIYNTEDIVDIQSEIGSGTNVTLKIPYDKGAVIDAKALNC
jgi:two-component system, sensor histidine kinase YesM